MDKLIVKTTPLFIDSMAEKLKSGGHKLAGRFEDFLKSKKDNAMRPFGKSDKPFINAGIIQGSIPNETLLHAHLTHDISVVYSLTGKDPRIMKLYGVFTHDDMGTGQPMNLKKQKSFSARLSNTGQA